jgi:hypothetical protein
MQKAGAAGQACQTETYPACHPDLRQGFARVLQQAIIKRVEGPLDGAQEQDVQLAQELCAQGIFLVFRSLTLYGVLSF